MLERGEPSRQGLRWILNAIPGFGKTTIASHIDGAAIVMVSGETGYITLRNRGLVPLCPYVAIDTWKSLLAFVRGLEADPQGIKALVFDALGGMEALCHTDWCETRYGGNWNKFDSYRSGYTTAANEWRTLLFSLSRLTAIHGMDIVILSHTAIRNFKNPDGPDFDRYEIRACKETIAETNEWADLLLFGKFISVIDQNKLESPRHKGKGGESRAIYTEHRDSHEASNRIALPAIIPIPNDRTQAWETLRPHFEGVA